MSLRQARQSEVMEALVGHVLAHGLGAASLRPLAAAAGTSDRMLLYYFGDKDRLIAAVLGRIASDLLTRLEAALPEGTRRPFPRLLSELWAAAASPELRPFMIVFFEAATLAGRGVEPYRAISGQIVEGFLAWASARLDEPDVAQRDIQAAELLTRIDGAMLMDMLGRRDIAEAALRASTPPAPGL